MAGCLLKKRPGRSCVNKTTRLMQIIPKDMAVDALQEAFSRLQSLQWVKTCSSISSIMTFDQSQDGTMIPYLAQSNPSNV
jgi:hypothetical protein